MLLCYVMCYFGCEGKGTVFERGQPVGEAKINMGWVENTENREGNQSTFRLPSG
jgi:hypothetical protein